jgi:colanic acid biosynthesis glycosyl transferase WcaI
VEILCDFIRSDTILSVRIVIHDVSGHPFQVQLSRELARRGHDVLHLYFDSFNSPRGNVHRLPNDPDNFSIEGLTFDRPFEKYNLPKRRLQEARYGRLAAERIAAFRPAVLVASNTPIDAQNIIHRHCRALGIPIVFWLQDVYSLAIRAILRRKAIPCASLIAGCAAAWYERAERRLLRESDAVVSISPDFQNILSQWGVESRRCFTIENWAPLEEVPVVPQDNCWSRRQNLAGKFVFLYSGTIGLKHNPGMLVRLADAFATHPDVAIVVISEGLGADWIKAQLQRKSRPNLRVLPLQPFCDLPFALASGGVLVALLGEESGEFSVPSKVLTYHCAGRPLLLAVPSRNLAARIVERNATGLVTPPDSEDLFVAAARRLYSDPGLRRQCGENARRYAEEKFDINGIATRFEGIIDGVRGQRRLMVA